MVMMHESAPLAAPVNHQGCSASDSHCRAICRGICYEVQACQIFVHCAPNYNAAALTVERIHRKQYSKATV
jgi:hypothetical protein